MPGYFVKMNLSIGISRPTRDANVGRSFACYDTIPARAGRRDQLVRDMKRALESMPGRMAVVWVCLSCHHCHLWYCHVRLHRRRSSRLWFTNRVGIMVLSRSTTVLTIDSRREIRLDSPSLFGQSLKLLPLPGKETRQLRTDCARKRNPPFLMCPFY